MCLRKNHGRNPCVNQYFGGLLYYILACSCIIKSSTCNKYFILLNYIEFILMDGGFTLPRLGRVQAKAARGANTTPADNRVKACQKRMHPHLSGLPEQACENAAGSWSSAIFEARCIGRFFWSGSGYYRGFLADTGAMAAICCNVRSFVRLARANASSRSSGSV